MAKSEEKKESASTRPVSVYASAEKGSGYIRTYSAEEHGANYIKLAEGFAKKIGGSVR